MEENENKSRKASIMDDEGTPLLQKDRCKVSFYEDVESGPAEYKPLASLGNALKRNTRVQQRSDTKGKLILYDHDSLLSMKSMFSIGHSILVQRPVVLTFVFCVCVTTITAISTFFIPSSSKLDTDRFDTFAIFLKVSISFMLGVYLAQSFTRWRYTVTAFEHFLIAIRQMVFMLHALRVQPKWREKVEMYCVASGYIFNCEVHNAQHSDSNKWADIRDVLEDLVWQEKLTNDERNQLLKSSSQHLGRTRAIWTWIAALISHPVSLDEKKILPQLLVRTIVLCQNCIGEIESMKMNITMQMPWMYANLLAILVHVNNAILSFTCGVSIGSAINEINKRHQQIDGTRESVKRHEELVEEMYEAVQVVAGQLCIVVLTPMLYVAFLHLANQLCAPFGDESHCLPTESWISGLEIELEAMAKTRDFFKRKHEEVLGQDLANRLPTNLTEEEWLKFEDGDGEC